MKKKHKLYACTTSIDTDIPMGAAAIITYTKLASLKKNEGCWKECGIVELEVKIKRVVKKPSPHLKIILPTSTVKRLRGKK